MCENFDFLNTKPNFNPWGKCMQKEPKNDIYTYNFRIKFYLNPKQAGGSESM